MMVFNGILKTIKHIFDIDIGYITDKNVIPK